MHIIILHSVRAGVKPDHGKFISLEQFVTHVLKPYELSTAQERSKACEEALKEVSGSGKQIPMTNVGRIAGSDE